MSGTILCDECIHNKVCMHKEKYKKTLDAMKEATVHLDNESFIKVRDISQFEAILDCTCLQRKPSSVCVQRFDYGGAQ